MSGSRDDFRKPTKDEIALRVGYLCSNPDCRQSTVGPKASGDGFINMGIAAHITAAASGGPRYDIGLSPDERRAASNGIWLCGNDAKLIDSDENHYTVDLLRKWKAQAEAQAFRDIATNRRSHTFLQVDMELDEADQARISGFSLPAEDDLAAVTRKVRAASKEDILAFKGQRSWPTHAVALNMQAEDAGGPHAVSVQGLAGAIYVAREVAVVAAPGTGKTTTLVQLTDAILTTELSVAIFVPLAEWSSGKDTIFQSLTHRNAFRHLREQHFMLLALHARLVLLLDGWNELDSDSRIRLIRELTALRRDFPLIGIAISTRHQVRDVPVSGPKIDIEPLSDEQQKEIAIAERGKEGEALLDQAWRSPGVRELIAIPLYLNALLRSSPGGTMPQTKEEVLRVFVDEHEKHGGRAEILERELLGVHCALLTALAIDATVANNTQLTEEKARSVISAAGDRLVAAGQIASRLEPSRVLNTLVDQHILIRGSDRSLSFQHQQFQEWYAAFEVEQLMLMMASGDEKAAKRLALDILNMPAWEESILFACERLSRSNAAGIGSVSYAVLRTLSVDPLLAAAMIHQSTESVWASVKEKVIAFAIRWHEPGKVDRAANFMITTGRPEFADQIWPLVSHTNDEIQLSAMQIARRFRPSVLGCDIDKRAAALPESIRDNLLSEIASRSGYDGIEISARIAKSDPAPEVQSSVIEALFFRRADRVALDILRSAPDAVWALVAQNGYDDEIDDEEASARLRRERYARLDKDTNPLRRLARLLELPRQKDDGVAGQIAEIIASENFPVKESDSSWKLKEALEHHPIEVGKALMNRIEMGRALPYGADEFMRSLPPVDDGPIPRLVRDTKEENNLANSGAALVGEKTVGQLIDALLTLNEEIELTKPIDEATRKDFWRLEGRIALTKPGAFLPALIQRSHTKDPRQIALLADLLARHGTRGEVIPLAVPADLLESLLAMVQRWVEALLSSPDAKRHDFGEVVRVIERLPSQELLDGLKRFLDEDLSRWRTARKKFLENPTTGDQDVNSEARTSYGMQYPRAFAAIGGDQVARIMEHYLTDLDFGGDAAYVLKEIWDKQQNVQKKDFFRPSPDFSEVPQRRAQVLQRHGVSSPLAEAVFAVVHRMSRTDSDSSQRLHAVKLARIGLSMPHGDKDQLIRDLLALPISHGDKHELLTSLVLAGYVISADLVLDGLRRLLDDAKTKSWLLDDNINRVGRRIALLPFSDRPRAVFEALDLVEPRFREPWKLGGLAYALGKSPNPDSEAILAELASRDGRFYGVHDWVSALISRRSLSVTKLLIELIASGALPQGSQSFDGWRFGQELAALIREHPSLQSELFQKYIEIAPSKGKSILEQTIAELATPEGFLVLVKEYAIMKRSFDSTLHRMLERIALGKQPVPEWRDAYQLYSLNVAELRKKLFAMLKDPDGSIAVASLIAIDEMRDEHGRNDAEPRHPDIASGQPWPIASAQI